MTGVGRIVGAAARVGVIIGVLATGLVAAAQPASAATTWATLQGTVTAQAGGVPLAGICVGISESGQPGEIRLVTNSAGHWSYNAEWGFFSVRFFEDPSCGTHAVDYAPEYWDNHEYSGAPWSGYGDWVRTGDYPLGSTITLDASLRRIDGAISGTVTDAVTGAPVAGVCVLATNVANNGIWYPTTTGATGAWSLTGVREGDYRVSFDGMCSGGTHSKEWYDNSPSPVGADLVSVQPGVTTTGIDAKLPEGGTITGAVRTDTGEGIPQVCVTARNPGTGERFEAVTNASGTYAITGLWPSTYQVRFVHCDPDSVGSFVSEWWNNQPTINTANTVTVATDQVVSSIDAVLSASPAISGTVTSDGTGAPVAGICVTANNPANNGIVADTRTLADGRYILPVPAGTYAVFFYRCDPALQPDAFEYEYWDDSSTLAGASTVTVTEGTTTGVNASLAPTASIAGEVFGRRSNGVTLPLAFACVEFYDVAGERVQSVSADQNGRYSSFPLTPGTYRVFTWNCLGGFSDGEFRPQWNGDAWSFDAAPPIEIVAGPRTVVNTTLAQQPGHALVIGNVREAFSNNHPKGICVDAFLSPSNFTYRTTTDTAGRYWLMLPHATIFRLRMMDCEPTVRYVTEWYTFGSSTDRRYSYDTASSLQVSTVAPLRLYDHGNAFDTEDLDLGGGFHGTLLNEADGTPIAGVCVSASSSVASGSTTSASDGTWAVRGLPPTTGWTVTYNTCANPQWETTSVSGLAVPLQGGSSFAGRSLRPRGAISGSAEWGDAGSVHNVGTDVCVAAYNEAGEVVDTDRTAFNSRYILGPLDDGVYRVRFAGCEGGYIPEWWTETAWRDYAPTFEDAQPITISGRNEVAEINARLTKVEDQPPTVAITSPVDGSSIQGPITIAADATDDVELAQVEFFVDGSSVGVDSDGTDAWSVGWDSSPLGDGAIHTITATATDTAAHTTTDEVAVTVLDSDVDPSVSLTAPADGSIVYGHLTLVASAEDDFGVDQVEFFVDGSSVGIDADGTDGWWVPWDSTSIGDGASHTIAVAAIDSAGQTASDEVLVTVLGVGVGDFDGDGTTDLVIGAPGEDFGAATDAGAVTVLYGDGARQLIHQDVAGVPDSNEANDRFGAALAHGDINGDGFDDLAIGAPGEGFRKEADVGAVTVIFGSLEGLDPAGTSPQFWNQNAAGMPDGNETGDSFGSALAINDFDDDTIPDLAIGAPGEGFGESAEAGAVTVVLSRGETRFLHQNSELVPDRNEPGDRFGAALAAADFDDDRIADLAIGAPGEGFREATDVGAVTVLSSRADPWFWHQNAPGVPDRNEQGDRFGAALEAADLNGDEVPDLVIGAPGEGFRDAADVGAVTIIDSEGAKEQIQQNAAGVPDRNEQGDRFGAALATADLNGDGIADLAIGAPGEGFREATDVGAVTVIPFKNKPWSWHQNNKLVPDGNEAGDQFGAALTTADLDGDTVADLVVGAPGEAFAPGGEIGAVTIFHSDATWQQIQQNAAGVPDSNEAGDRFGAAM